jgi:hypothetical protein
MTLDDLQHLSSPVAVAVRIRQDLAEFQRSGSKQALLKSLRADYILRHVDLERGAVRQQQATSTAGRFGNVTHDNGPATVVEHLEQRGLIRDPRRDSRRRLFSVINNPNK